jgi:hypothetical protein
MCCKNGSCNDVGYDQLGPCAGYQLMLNVVEILLADCYHVCMCVPRVMMIYVHLGLMWKQLGRISVTEFFEHDNVGNLT